MTSRPYLDYLEDSLDAIEKATEFIQGMTYEQFARCQDHVCLPEVKDFKLLSIV